MKRACSGSERTHSVSRFRMSDQPELDELEQLIDEYEESRRQRSRIVSQSLTRPHRKNIVSLWGSLTPRGNMVHQGIERRDGVQAQLDWEA